MKPCVCGTAKNQRDGRVIAVHHQGYMGNQHIFLLSSNQLLEKESSSENRAVTRARNKR